MQISSNFNLSFSPSSEIKRTIPYPSNNDYKLESLALSKNDCLGAVFIQDRQRHVHFWDLAHTVHQTVLSSAVCEPVELAFAGSSLYCTQGGKLGLFHEKHIEWKRFHDRPASLDIKDGRAATMGLNKSQDSADLVYWDLSPFKAVVSVKTDWQGRNKAMVLDPDRRLVVTVQSGRFDRPNEISLWDFSLWRNQKVRSQILTADQEIFSSALVTDGVEPRLLTRSYGDYCTVVRDLNYNNFGSVKGVLPDPESETWSHDGGSIVASYGQNYCLETKEEIEASKTQKFTSQTTVRMYELNPSSIERQDVKRKYEFKRSPENNFLDETTTRNAKVAMNDRLLATHGKEAFGSKQIIVVQA